MPEDKTKLEEYFNFLKKEYKTNNVANDANKMIENFVELMEELLEACLTTRIAPYRVSQDHSNVINGVKHTRKL